jgi:hypothetical protein
MLTFEGEKFQGQKNIIGKLLVCFRSVVRTLEIPTEFVLFRVFPFNGLNIKLPRSTHNQPLAMVFLFLFVDSFR